MEKSVKDLAAGIQEIFSMDRKDIRTYSPLTLAYIGDAVYDLVIRTLLIEEGNAPVHTLHKKASRIVKAGAQAELVRSLEPMLSEEEQGVYKRGRNAKSATAAKNASIVDYRTATGLEALIGYLYLEGHMDRILELVKLGLEQTGEYTCETKQEP